MTSLNFGHFWPPPPIVMLFITEAFVLLSQNPRPLHPTTVTSFMDDPLAEKVPKLLYRGGGGVKSIIEYAV